MISTESEQNASLLSIVYFVYTKIIRFRICCLHVPSTAVCIIPPQHYYYVKTVDTRLENTHCKFLATPLECFLQSRPTTVVIVVCTYFDLFCFFVNKIPWRKSGVAIWRGRFFYFIAFNSRIVHNMYICQLGQSRRRRKRMNYKRESSRSSERCIVIAINMPSRCFSNAFKLIRL